MPTELITNGTFTGNASGWDLLEVVYNSNNVIYPTDCTGVFDPSFIHQAGVGLNDGVIYNVSIDAAIPAGNTLVVSLGEPSEGGVYSDNYYTIPANGNIITRYTFSLPCRYFVPGGYTDDFYAKGHGAATDLVSRIIVDNVSIIILRPEYDPSIITSVKKISQNLPFPQYVIAGQGTGSLYKLFKKTTTQAFTLWRSPVYNIGKDFDVMSIEFNIIGGVASNKTIVPILYFDNERDSSVGTTINTTNYPNLEQLIQLTSKNFNNSVHGKHNFFLELQFTGTALAVVSTPINIDIDILDT